MKLLSLRGSSVGSFYLKKILQVCFCVHLCPAELSEPRMAPVSAGENFPYSSNVRCLFTAFSPHVGAFKAASIMLRFYFLCFRHPGSGRTSSGLQSCSRRGSTTHLRPGRCSSRSLSSLRTNIRPRPSSRWHSITQLLPASGLHTAIKHKVSSEVT